jgi:cytoskeletal protein CcmA (bactofilin family)
MAFGRSKDSDGDVPVARPTSTSAPTQGSIIAPGMTLDGDCESEGALQVDGHIKGNVRAARLTVGPGGRVDGDVDGSGDRSSDRAVVIKGTVGGAVKAHSVQVGPEGSIGGGMIVHDAVVRGRVQGGVETEHRLLLEETAVVEGDVTARRLGLKEGGQVFGTIRIGDRPSQKSGSSTARAPSMSDRTAPKVSGTDEDKGDKEASTTGKPETKTAS